MWGRVSMVVVAAASLGIAPGDAAADSGLESHLMQRANELRAASGLPSLDLDGSLGANAREWSSHMAAQGSLSHSTFVATGSGRRGENVGSGGDVDEVHAALASSPIHRANLVDPEFTRVGIGLVVAGDGTVFVTQQFVGTSAPDTGTAAPPGTNGPAPEPAPPVGPETGILAASERSAENPAAAASGAGEATPPPPSAAGGTGDAPQPDSTPEPSDRLVLNLTYLQHLDA